jgi:hypothetical protein
VQPDHLTWDEFQPRAGRPLETGEEPPFQSKAEVARSPRSRLCLMQAIYLAGPGQTLLPALTEAMWKAR